MVILWLSSAPKFDDYPLYNTVKFYHKYKAQKGNLTDSNTGWGPKLPEFIKSFEQSQIFLAALFQFKEHEIVISSWCTW